MDRRGQWENVSSHRLLRARMTSTPSPQPDINYLSYVGGHRGCGDKVSLGTRPERRDETASYRQRPRSVDSPTGTEPTASARPLTSQHARQCLRQLHD